MIRRAVIATLLVVGLQALAVPPAAAQTFESVFSKQYTRASGTPVTASDTFTVCDPAGTFRLVVVNGPTGQDQIGTDAISSGAISVNGTEVVHESDFNRNVARIERPLSGIAASNRIDVRVRSGPSGAILVNVDGVQSCGVHIASPAPGSTLRQGVIVVRGTLQTTPGVQVGVTVNGEPGLVEADRFVGAVSVDPTVTALTVETHTLDGVAGRATIPVTVVPAGEATVRLRPDITGGPAPLTVRFSLSTTVPVVQVVLDADGDGTVDFQGTALNRVGFTYTRPGLYVPAVRVTDDQGAVHTAVTIVHVPDTVALDVRLQALWTGFKDAVRAGDIPRAGRFLHTDTRADYQHQFARFSAAGLANIDQVMTTVQLIEIGFGAAEYEMLRLQDGDTLSFAVWFQLDEDGLWRLRRF